MKIRELIELLEDLAPVRYGCPDWDNIGLTVGNREDEIHKIYLAVDCDEYAIDQAVQMGCDFILSHHPLIFNPLRSLTADTLEGRKITKLIQNGIAVYGMHTNFDGAPGCMADLAADRIGLENTQPLLPTWEEEGIGRIGYLLHSVTLEQLCSRIKDSFDLPYVLLYDRGDIHRKISKVAILPGSGKDEVKEALAMGAQAYITGDMTHHVVIDAMEEGLAVIDAGHYGIEWIFLEKIEEYLQSVLPKDVEIIAGERRLPGCVI